jgi:hypothetical protein
MTTKIYVIILLSSFAKGGSKKEIMLTIKGEEERVL